MHCRCDQPWSAATSGRNVAVRLACRRGSLNSMMSPCVPICQSCQSAASSKAHSSDTEQLRCDTSLSCTGEKRESRKALYAEGAEGVKQAAEQAQRRGKVLRSGCVLAAPERHRSCCDTATPTRTPTATPCERVVFQRCVQFAGLQRPYAAA